MATGRFGGPLASEFAAFAATLEASATASKTTLTQLRALDRFTAQRGLPSGTIDETLAKAWLAGCATRAPNTRAARYYLLRRFCRFLATRRPGTFVPGESLRPRRRPPKPPHIYTRDEVRALLAGALALRDWTSRHPCPIRSATLHTLILLLATSGLRISEALHLTLADVDLTAGVLSVRQSKFRKSRLVPVSAGTLDDAAPLPRPARRCGARRSDRGLLRLRSRHRCPPLVPDSKGETRWHASKDIIQWLEDL